jgi:hypothetical protein
MTADECGGAIFEIGLDATRIIGPERGAKSAAAPSRVEAEAANGEAEISPAVGRQERSSRVGEVSITSRNKQFMEQVVVWPGANNPGWINLHCHMKNRDPAKNGGKDWVIGWPFKSIDEFIGRAKWLETTDQFFDVWYCTSQQSQIGENRAKKPKAVRLHRNATWLKAIWIDVDVKEGTYATVQEAWAVISDFRKRGGASDAERAGELRWRSARLLDQPHPAVAGRVAPLCRGLEAATARRRHHVRHRFDHRRCPHPAGTGDAQSQVRPAPSS